MTKTALVTGASKGIGSAIALELASMGYNIVVGYHKSAHSANEIAAKICDMGVRSILVQADLRKNTSIDNMFRQIFQVFPSVDILVNNAGISLVKPILDTTSQEWQELIDINLSAAYYTTKNVLPKMIENGYGRILNISSIWGMTGASCEVAYSATKAGLIGFTKALSREVCPNITINCIAPGIIDTEMNADMSEEEVEEFLKSVPAGRLGRPEEIAALVGFLTTEKAGYINGQVIGANGGYC